MEWNISSDNLNHEAENTHIRSVKYHGSAEKENIVSLKRNISANDWRIAAFIQNMKAVMVPLNYKISRSHDERCELDFNSQPVKFWIGLWVCSKGECVAWESERFLWNGKWVCKQRRRFMRSTGDFFQDRVNFSPGIGDVLFEPGCFLGQFGNSYRLAWRSPFVCCRWRCGRRGFLGKVGFSGSPAEVGGR